MSDHSLPQLNLPINYDEVLERIGGDRDFLDELLKMYIVEYREKSERIKAALNEQDFLALQKLGHSLKGSSANLSLNFLQKASLTLEMAGRDKNLALAQSAFTSLESEFEKLKDYLQHNPPNGQKS